MKKICIYDKYLMFIVIIASLALTGCSTFWMSSEVRSTEVIVDQNYSPDPGAVEYVYEPPMIDVIDVPPGLDPEGHYYRPSHQEIVEIRQGRWKYYKEK
jgi:hypothetical protein